MGHQEARRKKIELGLMRDLPSYEQRVNQACRWLVRWGFSTSKILNQLCLSKNDLARMKKERLVDDFPTAYKPQKDSRAIPLTIWFPTLRGRKLGEVGGYTGKRSPDFNLISHDLICQSYVCQQWFDQFGGPKVCPDFGARSARMLAKAGCPGIELQGYLPDCVYGMQNKLKVVEVERNPVLKKYGDSAELEQFKFLNKLNYLVGNLQLPVTLLYMTQRQADDNWILIGSAAAYGYPSFYKTASGEWWPDGYWDGERKVRIKKEIEFAQDEVRCISLQNTDLSRWLPV